MINKITLYKSKPPSTILEWQIEVEDNKYRTITGQLTGKKVTSAWTVVQGKNIGRSNETSPAVQAWKEAIALSQKKKDRGYRETIRSEEENRPKTTTVEPMLAQKYNPEKPPSFPLFIQPKIDGFRAIYYKGEFRSRNMKPIPVPADSPLVLPDLPYHLDGEMYIHGGHSFNDISSAAKKPGEGKLKLQYWVFDAIIPDKTFEERYKTLISLKDGGFFPNNWVLVPTFEAESEKDLSKLYQQFMNDKYEGAMLRLNTNYEQGKRSKSLLKMKAFTDDEFVIHDIVEGDGNRSGMAGYLVVMSNSSEPSLFRSNINGNREFLRNLLKNKADFIGKTATIKYFELSKEKGIPRFPTAIKFDRESVE